MIFLLEDDIILIMLLELVEVFLLNVEKEEIESYVISCCIIRNIEKYIVNL